jgi:hypothetical protein
MRTRNNDIPPSPTQTDTEETPFSVRRLTSSSGRGGRIENNVAPQDEWKLDEGCRLTGPLDSDSEDEEDYNSISSSEGSQVTILDTEVTTQLLPPREIEIPPASPLVGTTDPSVETPPNVRNSMRKKPDDCHVLIRWSELVKLVQDNFVCSGCGEGIRHLDRRTIGIATEIDFFCSNCKKEACANADRTDYVMEKAEKDFIRRERRIDSYTLNWRLIMATQMMGESQVGGSIISLFLDLSREAFRKTWSPMEDLLGVEQRLIGQEVVDSNLLRETMGKTAITCDDGKIRHPIRVSYDMGWQKASRAYNSLSGHGLMIGESTNRVICFQNYSKACRKCQLHAKAIKKKKTPDIPVPSHHCPKNYEGSSKGMEAEAALDCVKKVWSHEEILVFIEIICLDDDATTKAYLAHCFADLDLKGLPRPTNKKGEPKTSSRDNKGKLWTDHPVIAFLADLSHRVRTFGKYIYALKNVGKKRSEMNDVDALRLKRNFAWWLFSGTKLTFEEYRDSSMSPVLHHFNDHSQCGTWCMHRDKTEEELAKLDKYRCKQKNAKLYSQCLEIMERFTSDDHLRECHHLMSSQKNEAMNKSIMRYVPKDRTLCRSMVLTSRISCAISIDSLGHAEYFLLLFRRMKFQLTALTCSGLRRMWRRKEYLRMRQQQRQYKVDRRIKLRTAMIEGVKKQEKDVRDGRAYDSGIRMADGTENENDDNEQSGEAGASKTTTKSKSENKRTSNDACRCGGRDHKRITSNLCPWFGLSKAQILEKCDENVNNEQSGEEGAGLKASATRTTSSSNNKRTGNDSCRCGGRDHKRITSKNCPWFGLSKAQILEKCAENDEKMKEKNNVESTLENLKCTATLVRVPTNDLEENVQSTGKL